MLFRDALRAQYYLRVLQQGQTRLEDCLERLKPQFPELKIAALTDRVVRQLADQLDQLLLPIIAYEVAITKAIGALVGDTSEARYDSFFVCEGSWTLAAKSLPRTYQNLF
jgi:lantibiotic modifying enzyme